MAKRGRKIGTAKQSSIGEVEVPPGLSDAEEDEFHRLVGEIRRIGTLERTDVRIIEAAARTQILIDRAHRELGEGPLTLEAANGTAMPHPMLAVVNAQTMRLRGLLADLGLTAKSSKLGNAKTEKIDSRWDGMLTVTG